MDGQLVYYKRLLCSAVYALNNYNSDDYIDGDPDGDRYNNLWINFLNAKDALLEFWLTTLPFPNEDFFYNFLISCGLESISFENYCEAILEDPDVDMEFYVVKPEGYSGRGRLMI